ncbi:4'-phosphopantetheinyl transferase superfamily protein [Chryseobacterium soli]|uniref:4'-phosphopantetheinyl transferase family protein n=1 Tax=Chryseobacterium soli TaxID=445961 RepID=UPI002954AA68|nr:4'-phosphopantetheinyl transferase superfamily protein [Chryseobacterium soli]MDV7696674.1 4'-phosphopantetheinyl transferase superfamily protein [Chryseobacterium soli]
MIILYAFIHEEKHQDLLDTYLPVFSGKFREDILKYRRWQDAQLSLLGKVLLEHGLKVYYDIKDAEIDLLENKKPILKGHDIHFNISHSKDLVVCAIAEAPIGIDVEFLDPQINYLDFKSQMTSDEFHRIHHSDSKIKSFFTYWTSKEAILKAHGDGMMIPLESFEITGNECSIDNEKFYVKELFIDKKYQSCIASADINIKEENSMYVHVKLEDLF